MLMQPSVSYKNTRRKVRLPSCVFYITPRKQGLWTTGSLALGPTQSEHENWIVSYATERPIMFGQLALRFGLAFPPARINSLTDPMSVFHDTVARARHTSPASSHQARSMDRRTSGPWHSRYQVSVYDVVVYPCIEENISLGDQFARWTSQYLRHAWTQASLTLSSQTMFSNPLCTEL